MPISLEDLVKVVRLKIQTNTGISATSFGCGVRGGLLMVKLIPNHIKREVELPVGVIKEAGGQVVKLFSQDHKALADTVVAMLQ